MKRNREIRIHSSLEELYRVEQFVEEISDEYMLYGSYFGNIMMAVSEAVKNAMIHGNGKDPSKKVRIIQEYTKQGLWVSISDEGRGFNYKEHNYKDPEAGFDFEKKGLLMICKLCDDVRFMHEGRTISMLFRINGIDETIFSRREAFMQEFFKVYQSMNT